MKTSMRSRIFTMVVMLFAAIVLMAPSKTQAVDGFQVQRLNCETQATVNYNNCMNSPAGTNLACSAWYYYDMSRC